MLQDVRPLSLQTQQTQLLALLLFAIWVCVCVYVDLVRRLDVCEALDQVGTLHLRQRGVEGVLAEAGDDQTHQAGVNHHLVHDVLQTCSHRTDQRGQRHGPGCLSHTNTPTQHEA